jgi:hypothetical protein
MSLLAQRLLDIHDALSTQSCRTRWALTAHGKQILSAVQGR